MLHLPIKSALVLINHERVLDPIFTSARFNYVKNSKWLRNVE